MSKAYDAARAKESEILERIKSSGDSALKAGLRSTLPERGTVEAGYLVFLKFDGGDNLVRHVGDMSKDIRRSLGGRSIVYEGKDVHQTLAAYDLVRSAEDGDTSPNSETLRTLGRSVKEARGLESGVGNSFGGFYFNDNSVILTPLRGMAPNTHGLIADICANSEAQGLVAIKGAWGSHLTVSRFNSVISPSELEDFQKLMEERRAFPTADTDGDWYSAKAVGVGHFVASQEGFDLTTEEEFSLK